MSALLAPLLSLGPIACEVLQTVIAAPHQRLYRTRGGYAPLGSGPVYTRRIVNKLERDGLLRQQGKFGDEFALTAAGFTRALQLRAERLAASPVGAPR